MSRVKEYSLVNSFCPCGHDKDALFELVKVRKFETFGTSQLWRSMGKYEYIMEVIVLYKTGAQKM